MSIHVCKCEHNGQEEWHLRYPPGMTKGEAQKLVDQIKQNEWLALLRIAVTQRRECHRAYSEFTLSINWRFPTREERDKEVALRSALGLAERAVMDAAEAMTPND